MFETTTDQRIHHRSPGLYDRLLKRKFLEWIIGYLAAGWLILQWTEVMGEIWGWSSKLEQTVSLVVAAGLLPASVIAWYHGEKGRQRVCGAECLLLSALLVCGGALVVLFCAA